MEQVYLVTGASTAHARIETLVKEHQVKLARYLRRMLGDPELALDVSQEVFLAAYRTLQSDPERPLSAGWLYKTATNNAISLLRRKRILQFFSLEGDRETRGLRIDECSVASLDLQTALRKLPPEQVAALMLTSYAGYSSAEAGAILGTSPQAVRQRVCRAVKILRAVMVQSA